MGGWVGGTGRGRTHSRAGGTACGPRAVQAVWEDGRLGVQTASPHPTPTCFTLFRSSARHSLHASLCCCTARHIHTLHPTPGRHTHISPQLRQPLVARVALLLHRTALRAHEVFDAPPLRNELHAAI
eukprot:365672-Chlamydomonas_euryale.AAC.13